MSPPDGMDEPRWKKFMDPLKGNWLTEQGEKVTVHAHTLNLEGLWVRGWRGWALEVTGFSATGPWRDDIQMTPTGDDKWAIRREKWELVHKSCSVNKLVWREQRSGSNAAWYKPEKWEELFREAEGGAATSTAQADTCWADYPAPSGGAVSSTARADTSWANYNGFGRGNPSAAACEDHSSHRQSTWDSRTWSDNGHWDQWYSGKQDNHVYDKWASWTATSRHQRDQPEAGEEARGVSRVPEAEWRTSQQEPSSSRKDGATARASRALSSAASPRGSFSVSDRPGSHRRSSSVGRCLGERFRRDDWAERADDARHDSRTGAREADRHYLGGPDVYTSSQWAERADDAHRDSRGATPWAWSGAEPWTWDVNDSRSAPLGKWDVNDSRGAPPWAQRGAAPRTWDTDANPRTTFTTKFLISCREFLQESGFLSLNGLTIAGMPKTVKLDPSVLPACEADELEATDEDTAEESPQWTWTPERSGGPPVKAPDDKAASPPSSSGLRADAPAFDPGGPPEETARQADAPNEDAPEYTGVPGAWAPWCAEGAWSAEGDSLEAAWPAEGDSLQGCVPIDGWMDMWMDGSMGEELSDPRQAWECGGLSSGFGTLSPGAQESVSSTLSPGAQEFVPALNPEAQEFVPRLPREAPGKPDEKAEKVETSDHYKTDVSVASDLIECDWDSFVIRIGDEDVYSEAAGGADGADAAPPEAVSAAAESQGAREEAEEAALRAWLSKAAQADAAPAAEAPTPAATEAARADAAPAAEDPPAAATGAADPAPPEAAAAAAAASAGGSGEEVRPPPEPPAPATPEDAARGRRWKWFTPLPATPQKMPKLPEKAPPPHIRQLGASVAGSPPPPKPPPGPPPTAAPKSQLACVVDEVLAKKGQGWRAVLRAAPFAQPSAAKGLYRQLMLVLHPDKRTEEQAVAAGGEQRCMSALHEVTQAMQHATAELEAAQPVLPPPPPPPPPGPPPPEAPPSTWSHRGPMPAAPSPAARGWVPAATTAPVWTHRGPMPTAPAAKAASAWGGGGGWAKGATQWSWPPSQNQNQWSQRASAPQPPRWHFEPEAPPEPSAYRTVQEID